ncbi:MAG: hypothetical protein PHX62_08100 [Bacilli bacterium]|nr:hypothetical protein [Bacilli bacterium]
MDENNRWVFLSKIVPWEEFAQLYYKNFKSNRGAPTKDARLVLGLIIIKHIMKTDDLIRKGLKLKYFFVIRHLLEQQESMYKKKSHQVKDRIVNIHQPHVRPIVRG